MKEENLNYEIHPSPMFMFTREEFNNFNKNNKIFRLSSFYTYGRKKFNILVDRESKPIGGRWSFDLENRKKIVRVPSKIDFQFQFPFQNQRLSLPNAVDQTLAIQ